MTIRDFEIFIAVAETGQMGVASRKLYITQPTVSHAIMQIEKEYHVKLFERLKKALHNGNRQGISGICQTYYCHLS